MQWNLTGLRGATLAEELINVWGPAGVKCAFADILDSQTGALAVPTVQQKYCQDIQIKMNVTNMTHWQAHRNDGSNTFGVTTKVPDFPWFTVCGNADLSFELFPPKLPDNVMKRSSLICPHSNLPLALICHSSATPLPQVIYSVSNWILHLPGFCHADRRTLGDTQRWLQRDRHSWSEITFARIGVSPAFAGIWDNWCVPSWTKSFLLTSNKCQNRVWMLNFVYLQLTLK